MKFIKVLLRGLHDLFVGGLMVYLFYGWFILPVFTQLPPINYWEAIGINSFLYLFNKIKPVDMVFHKQHEDHDLVKYGWLVKWTTILFGFLVNLIITNFGG